MNLSVLMITKNAEKELGKTVESVRSLAEKIVVVDSGSMDGTIAVAKRYTNRVYIRPFSDSFSELRNFALSNVRGDWILAIDADERLSEEAKRAIPQLVKSTTVDGYWLRRKTFISPTRYLKYGLFYPDYQLRLFRRKKEYRYVGAVHEQLTIPKEKTREVPYDILHYPTHPKYDRFSSVVNMYPYMRIAAKSFSGQYGAITLGVQAIVSFVTIFVGGFFRGKGFLDGWAGFRAHTLFAFSISGSYALALIRKLKD